MQATNDLSGGRILYDFGREMGFKLVIALLV